MVNLMEGIIPEYSRKGVIRGPSGSSVTGIVPTNAYPTAQPSAFVVIGANGDSIYARLMAAIGRPDLIGSKYAQNQDRVLAQAEIEDAISTWTRTKDPEEVCSVMDEARVPVGRIMNVKDLMANEHVRARGMVERVWVNAAHSTKVFSNVSEDEAKGWELDVPRVAPRLEDGADSRWAGPNLGEHTNDVLAHELGLGEEQLSRLRREGTIG